MIKEVMAPVAKTLFIPTGNPGALEVKEIRAVPRLSQANANDQEITLSGELDLDIMYLPLTAKEGLEFSTQEEEVIARLEMALQHDVDDEDDVENWLPENLEDKLADERTQEEKVEWYQLEISVPFTVDIEKGAISEEQVIKLDPRLHSCQWLLVDPRAIEFEGVLKLSSKEEVDAQAGEKVVEPLPRVEASLEEEAMEELKEENEEAEAEAEGKEIEEVELGEKEIVEEEGEIREGIGVTEATEKVFEEAGVEKDEDYLANNLIENFEEDVLGNLEEGTKAKEIENQGEEREEIQEKIVEMPAGNQEEIIDQEIKPLFLENIKPYEPPKDTISLNYPEKGNHFQMKFYRVQTGEDLDAIAEKFGISRERLRASNAIHEEEIRTGLLLTIPGR